jgi:hypothetical protein
MLGFNGGLIGKDQTTSASQSLPGMWTLTEHLEAVRNNLWTRPLDPIVTNGLVLNLDAGQQDSYPGSGTTWTDLSGNGNNGTLTNGPTFNSANGGSIVFDGSNDYVTLGTPALMNGVQVPLTICMWAKANAFSTYNTLWGVYNGTTGGLLYSLFRVDSGTLRYFTSNSSGRFQFNGSFAPSTSVWNFYVVTVSGTLSSPSVTIYLNSSSQTFSYSTLTSSPNLSVDFKIGSNSYGNELWNGNISNVMWYNRALTATEISQNFNALRSRYGI